MNLKKTLSRLVMRSTFLNRFHQQLSNLRFPGSAPYWEKRYRNNGNSGVGSYGVKAAYKAAFLNAFVKENKIDTVLEFGCGDGNQLMRFQFPSYTGLDVSVTAIEKCKALFKADATKCFFLYDDASQFSADLVLSLDVVYHLVEDAVFEKYMHTLFEAATRFVVIYAWDTESAKRVHVRHRKFTRWIGSNIKGFTLVRTVSPQHNEPVCDLFIYQKINSV